MRQTLSAWCSFQICKEMLCDHENLNWKLGHELEEEKTYKSQLVNVRLFWDFSPNKRQKTCGKTALQNANEVYPGISDLSLESTKYKYRIDYWFQNLSFFISSHDPIRLTSYSSSVLFFKTKDPSWFWQLTGCTCSRAQQTTCDMARHRNTLKTTKS